MTFFRSIGQSLHNPLFYKQVFRDRENGIGFKYLAQLLTLCWLIVAVILTVLIVEARKDPESPLLYPARVLHKIAPHFPVIVIEKGKARVEGNTPQPITLNDPVSGNPVMLIDTTGKVTSLNGSKADILLTRATLRIRYEGEDITYELPDQLDATIDSGKLEDWANFMEKMMPYAPFIMVPFNVLGGLLMLSMRWLMMGVIGFIALKPTRPETRFADVLRISAYAMTASQLVKILVIGLGIQPFGAPEWVLLAIDMLYLFFAVSAVRHSHK